MGGARKEEGEKEKETGGEGKVGERERGRERKFSDALRVEGYIQQE